MPALQRRVAEAQAAQEVGSCRGSGKVVERQKGWPRKTDVARVTFLLGMLAWGVGGVEPSSPPPPAGHAEKGGAAMTWVITSPAFQHGATIPPKYTADGPDMSPPLQWTEPPAGTQAFALLCEDPDAPGGLFVHWVLYDLPAQTREIPTGIPRESTVLGSARQGRNDFGTLGYRGPAPPPGKPHRYVFKLYALSRPPNLRPGATREDLLKAIEGAILDRVELMGTYQRTARR